MKLLRRIITAAIVSIITAVAFFAISANEPDDPTKNNAEFIEW